MKTAQQEFTEVIKGKNFMTPEILFIKHAGKYVVELSTGTGIAGEELFGVTVVDPSTKSRVKDLTKCFFYKTQALKHIEDIGKKTL